jgi:hypothetical protein
LFPKRLRGHARLESHHHAQRSQLDGFVAWPQSQDRGFRDGRSDQKPESLVWKVLHPGMLDRQSGQASLTNCNELMKELGKKVLNPTRSEKRSGITSRKNETEA